MATWSAMLVDYLLAEDISRTRGWPLERCQSIVSKANERPYPGSIWERKRAEIVADLDARRASLCAELAEQEAMYF